MKTLIGFEEIEDKIITLRGQKVLLDRDVAHPINQGENSLIL